ncbi:MULTISPECIES: D-alanyl-D-alanine carboxypeptidase family protein [unclassified Halomonas]|uniref:D-alanyl-D-alanine carboxypeptidase family protein n=1 Tax=unclassified Halomonas TaxID=2609666 RepID=UPI0006DBCAD6|nr:MULTISPECIES: D-alanyl-D-alanine carboxypeptidase family protein [unclassified Halomonas]KPQ24255.1 MAG: D-alanyl-D-alanine carboxypeptidase (penicillin-binding protein 5/6) [Halomonas sp. HL-93]SBR48265.1 penicillin-binding protein 6. Serine peptidase. MEROPS family S11 [Halomonas sp. HL-93]SNY95830.1 penicillin-binding protein 6. Serine peptidase. MEROPS family S11 [Halomonas sp. hl-4]
MNVFHALFSSARLCVLAAAIVVTPSVSAQDVPEPQTIIPAPPQLAASSWILMDADSGEILAEKNSDERLPPASLTKLMTAYLVERELDRGSINLEDQVSISENAWRTGGSKMFVEVGEQVAVEDLLHGIVIVSGNDASVAMAEHLAGGEAPFADLMNQHASRLGMKNSNFENPTGLPGENHYSSAHDMALLTQHIVNDYPEHYAIYSQRNFTYGGIEQPNRNRLLWRDPSVDGLKTGWTSEAGYGLVSSAKRDDMRLISVVMGTESEEARAQETQKLLSYGFRFFETMNLYERGAVLAKPRIWGGDINEVRVGVDEDVTMTLPRNRNDELRARLNLNSELQAPLAVGDEVGTLEIHMGDDVVGERQLVALEDVEEGGFFKQLLDQVRRFFSNLISNFTD